MIPSLPFKSSFSFSVSPFRFPRFPFCSLNRSPAVPYPSDSAPSALFPSVPAGADSVPPADRPAVPRDAVAPAGTDGLLLLHDPPLAKRAPLPAELAPQALLSAERPAGELLEGHALEEAVPRGESGMLMGSGTAAGLLEFALPQGGRGEATAGYEGEYEAMLAGSGEGYIDEGGAMLMEMDAARRAGAQPGNAAQQGSAGQTGHGGEAGGEADPAGESAENETGVWTSTLIEHSQSRVKKGKRCPVCSTRCGNSSKFCSVCHSPFKTISKTGRVGFPRGCVVKRYRCSVEGCGALFHYESQLLAHMRTHNHIKVSPAGRVEGRRSSARSARSSSRRRAV